MPDYAKLTKAGGKIADEDRTQIIVTATIVPENDPTAFVNMTSDPIAPEDFEVVIANQASEMSVTLR